MNMTRKQFFSYTFMPQVRPRLQELFSVGFQHIPYFMALVYQAVRLLPANHPYLDQNNLGKYGIRHVIAQAANNLVLSRNNIDQIILFAVILFGVGLFFIQILLVLFSVFSFVQPAMAASGSPPSFTAFKDFFGTPVLDLKKSQAGMQLPQQDLAFIMLDMVFGIPDLFKSCVSTTMACFDGNGEKIVDSTNSWILSDLQFPYPAHHALHYLFSFYSTGILVVAAFITSYFIVTVVLETAQTGTPFGKRFNKVWAPIRIVVAIGLLIPVNYGLNAAQYIVLYAAKYGSNFATNGWILFTDIAGSEGIAVGDGRMISEPTSPEIGGLLQFTYVATVCRDLYAIAYPDDPPVKMYLVKSPLAEPNMLDVHTLANLGGQGSLSENQAYMDMVKFADGQNQVIIRFGQHDKTKYPEYQGNVKPVCGEMVLPLMDPRIPGSAYPPDPAAEIMQRYYWYILFELWNQVFYNDLYDHYMPVDTLHQLGREVSFSPIGGWTTRSTADHAQWSYWTAASFMPQEPMAFDYPVPPDGFRKFIKEIYQQDILAIMYNPKKAGFGSLDGVVGELGAIEAQAKSDRWDFDIILKAKGWAGAGIWYNKIAELNGSLSGALYNLPSVTRYPEIMEDVLQQKKAHEENVSGDNRYEPVLAGNKAIVFDDDNKMPMAQAMWAGFKYWQQGGLTSSTNTALTGNAFVDAINGLLGTSGLYSMQRNEGVHPLAQLVGVGRSLINSAIMNLGGSVAVTAGNNILGKSFGGGASAVVGILMTIMMIGLTVGFVLFYIVPFLPFIYFFFAVGGWVKGIFEAMVGVPLWALAHIRIDGDGLPGQAAMNGYYLVFEIFIRPILIIFGLLASISIFAALVSVMNDMWQLVTSNLAGFDMQAEISGKIMTPGGGSRNLESLSNYFRSPVDEFFFTIIYTIVVYMMAMSSFKLIDLIPNNILRWMGQALKTFNDEREDAARSMMGTAAVGGQQAIRSVGGGVQGLLTRMNQPNKAG